MGMYKCPTCNKAASYKFTCKFCGVVFCSNSPCKGTAGKVVQSNKSDNAQCQTCKKTRALVKERAWY